ncbi:GFA family protein [Segnochrobactrum spirostomi]|uniref:GFA family protein n=1 Tax=Segnochrobactrum spirostomi TaxID=2608987 RepID=UPI0028AEDC96|nr:GFA family protein [Segnochrobactrum spirostomi]
MEGGCLCGAVRYAFDGEPLSSGICYCETCRRAASAPRLPFVGVRSAGFRFIRGLPVDYTSSPGVTRSFCGRCGSPLTYRPDDSPDELDVMTVSLDDPNAVAPTFHVWTSEALDWDDIAGPPTRYPRSRNG